MMKAHSCHHCIPFLLVLLVCFTQTCCLVQVEEDDTNGQQEQVLLHKKSLLNEAEEIPDLFPFRWQDWIGFACTVIGLMLAAGGGIGGGGVLLPIYILIFGFPVKHAIPLASSTVWGGAVANNLLNCRKKHPENSSASCIDWDLLLQLEPMTIAGTLIGASLNDFLPDIVLVIFLLALLTLTASKTLQKAHVLYQQETRELQEASAAQEQFMPLKRSIADSFDTDNDFLGSEQHDGAVYGAIRREHGNGEQSLSPHKERSKRVWIDITKLILLFAAITCLNLLKGGPGEGGGPMGVSSCGATCFWLTELAMLGLIFVFAWHVRRAVLARTARDSHHGWEASSEIGWDEDNTIQYPALAIVAGLAAGMFGIGGGIVKGPLMLALGVHPAVASATSACMILFTSSTATISYAIFGNLVYDYAAASAALGFTATLAGQTIMTALMERYHQRHSYIAYSIGIVVALSAVCMTAESVLAIMAN